MEEKNPTTQNKNKKPSIHSHQAVISSQPLPLTKDMQVNESIKNSLPLLPHPP